MAKQRQRLVEVPFSKTDCGVDFYINTARGDECLWVLTEHKVFKTDFFEIFFIKKANGYVLIDYRNCRQILCLSTAILPADRNTALFDVFRK